MTNLLCWKHLFVPCMEDLQYVTSTPYVTSCFVQKAPAPLSYHHVAMRCFFMQGEQATRQQFSDQHLNLDPTFLVQTAMAGMLKLSIHWLNQLPAPRQLMEFVSCGCKKGCKTARCSCSDNGLICTDICNGLDYTNCSNDPDDGVESEASTLHR